MSLNEPAINPSRSSGRAVRTAPAGYVAIQDLWADDVLICTSPLARTGRVSSTNEGATGPSGIPAYLFLWALAALAVVGAGAVVLLAG